MSGIDQKEYLKKYLGLGKGSGEKKKKKKSKLGIGLKIVDDDIDARLNEEIQEDLNADNDEAPQIVSVIDDRPPSLRIDEETRSKMWKPIGAPDALEQVEKNIKFEGSIKLSSNLGKKQMSLKQRDFSPNKKVKHLEASKKSFATLSKELSQSKKKMKHESKSADTDVSPLRQKRSEDISPPRKARGQDESDNSPPRRSRTESDISLVRKRRNSNDFSPILRKEVADMSPPRRKDRIGTHKDSSPAKGEIGADVDYSPPRKIKREPNEDSSPPRRNRREEMEDSSYPKRTHVKSDSSPPRRKERDESKDYSPPRRRRDAGSDTSPPKRSKRDKSEDKSPPRKRRGEEVDSSPPGRIRREKSEDSSPLRRKRDRKSRWADSEETNERLQKTLDGKTAGLQNAMELVKETEELKVREDALFRNLSSEVSGANAATIVRRKKNDVDPEEEERKRKIEEETKEKYNKWGRGLKQVQDVNEKIKTELHEMNKPLARYADDEDLERHLKEQEREGDPMLAYIRQKKRKKAVEEGAPVIQQYEGDAPPNRFGIRPGYRWDGVDRSNGYEKKWFEVQNSRKASIEESYKWSTEDM